MINRTIDVVLVSLLNVYAPNENNAPFMKTLFDLIVEKTQGILLIGVDFVMWQMSPYIKSPSSSMHSSTTGRGLKNLCEELSLADVWRHLHPRDRDYTFYSHCHATYSRMDCFFKPINELYRVLKCQIHNTILSDHALVSMDWDAGWSPTHSKWRQNISLLNRPSLQAELKNEFALFLKFNNKEDISLITLWEAAAVVLRGKIIYFSSNLKKARTAKHLESENKIRMAEKQHKEIKDIEDWEEFKIFFNNNSMNREVERATFWLFN